MPICFQSSTPILPPCRSVSRSVCPRSTRAFSVPVRVGITAQTASPGAKSRKKASPLNFARDIRGNAVWTLRVAKTEDAESIHALMKDAMPQDLIESLIETNEGCLVCEASVKGRKEGEGYVSKILGAILVDVSFQPKDKEKGVEGGLVKSGYVVAIVTRDMPAEENVKNKLVLGSLKKLKESGCEEAVATGGGGWGELLFKQRGDEWVCRLLSEMPDPQKKIMTA